MVTGAIKNPKMKGTLPCRMVRTLRSALELGHRRVGLDGVGLLLNAGAERVGRAAAVEQFVGRGARLLVELGVPAVEEDVHHVVAGRLESSLRAGDAGAQVDAFGRTQDHRRRLREVGEAVAAR